MKIKMLLTAVLLVMTVSCMSQSKATGELRSVDYSTFVEAIERGEIPIIDVRTAEEYAAGHIPGAVNIDVSSANFEEQICQFDKSEPLAIYCRSGRRSKDAAKRINNKGYDVIELDKGILSWEGDIVVPEVQTTKAE